MSEDTARRIAELEATLEIPGLPAAARETVEAQLRALRGSVATVNNTGKLQGNAAAINFGTMQTFFGGAPGEDGERLLRAYLEWLGSHCDELRLTRLRERPQSGNERQTAPELRLQDVYTSLTTDGPEVVVQRHERPARHVQRLIAWLGSHDRTPEAVAPECVRLLRFPTDRVVGALPPQPNTHPRADRMLHSGLTIFEPSDVDFEGIDPDAPIRYVYIRPELALEAIHTNKHLVLLGEPGSGKSTVLRYLALLLALRLNGAPLRIPGWPANELPVPILCPLGQVAAALGKHDNHAYDALRQVLGDILEDRQMARSGLRSYLNPALREGGVLLLCDGLDEVPVGAGEQGPRARIMHALTDLAKSCAARIVVTSRVKPYHEAHDWQLPASWTVRTIRPLAFGQVRTFVRSWYIALSATMQNLDSESAQQRAEQLVEQVESTKQLRDLVDTPLLLTMLALLHSNREGNIPRDRARLYDECVQLLLERWEPHRTIEITDRPSALQRLMAQLPQVKLEQLREEIHKLAFTAHAQPPGDDGRGQLHRHQIEGPLTDFFERFDSTQARAHMRLFLDVVREEAGLLIARDDSTAYTFPHLTFQEYLAGCYLAEESNALEVAYKHWRSADRERWRQVLLLFVGQLNLRGRKDIEQYAVPWLDLLCSPTVGQPDGNGRTIHVPKDTAQRNRDTVLAALSYEEIGGQAALANSMRNLVAQVENPLRQAIVDFLSTPTSSVTQADRIAATRVLGRLGDPRFPVELAEWRKEALPNTFGQPGGYWRFLPAGEYRIGEWQEAEQEEPNLSVTVVLKRFWSARYPITVAQFTRFIDQGGYGAEAERWWTKRGWQWKQARQLNQPWGWDNRDYNGANQPIIGVTWYEASAFCAWLSEQLVGQLPKGYLVRLPNEAEWEAAASYALDEPRRSYPWGEDEPTVERAIYNASGLHAPAPIGCCPAGVAACGALDMAGNVWEWCANSYKAYPAKSVHQRKDFTEDTWDVPLRGGSFYDNSTSVRCGARNGSDPSDGYDDLGFRCVVAPRSH